MSGTLAPQFYYTALDDSGNPISGALVDFYASGTTTPQTVYADAALTTPLSSPAVCDSAGRLVAYMTATSYKVRVRTAAGVVIKTIDPVQAVGASSGGVGSALGTAFGFLGDPTSPVSVTAYPAGTTYDKLHAGTAIFNIDSATLAAGTYVLESMLLATAGTLSVALVDLDDGTPDAPMVAITSTSTTGERKQSSAITFAPAGAAKNYGIKTKTSAGDPSFAWGIKLVRTL